jgi:uncharacterized protein (TIGR03437 family)
MVIHITARIASRSAALLLLCASASLAQDQPGRRQPAAPDRRPVANSSRRPARTADGRAVRIPGHQPAFVPNRYAVFLTDQPVGARYVTRESLQTAEARNYRQQVERAQATVKSALASRNIRVVGSVATLLNAIFVVAPPESLAELKAIPGVAGVMPMRTGRRFLNVATQLMNAAPPGNSLSPYPPAWNVAPGGSSNAGAGIKIGIIDSGIDQTHPAFQDSTLPSASNASHTYPICNSDPAWSCSAFTSNKVIVARSYVRQVSAYAVTDPANPIGANPTPNPATSEPDDYSPRDRDGHGTAVASAVAAVNASEGIAVPITGMAPKAYLGNYKVYGSPGVNDYPPEDVYIQALDDAVNDGMDIVNFSSGAPATSGAKDTGAACGNPSGVPCDPLAYAFEIAAEGGLVIVAAAGNFGDDSETVYPLYASIASPGSAPSVITAGATINGHAFGPSVSVPGPGAPPNLQNIASVASDSYNINLGGLVAPLVDAGFVGDGYACNALPYNSLLNSFALVQRGPTASPCDFATKAANAANAGAIGMILYQAPDSPASWNTADPTYNFIESVSGFTGPIVGISNSAGVNLQSYIDTIAVQSYVSNGSVDPWPLVTIDSSGAVRGPDPSYDGLPAIVNSVATFSSTGPTVAYFPITGCSTCTGSLIKPDLVATGGGDYYLYPDPNGDLEGFAGLYTAAENYDPNGEVYSSTRYAAVDGTSFSSPLTAGAAALVKQAHPGYTVAQIKSALVNWSNASATNSDDFGDPADLRQIGAGLLDAGAAAQAAITATPATISFGAVKTGGSLPAAVPITIANLGSHAVTLTVAVAQQAAAAGATVTVNPSSLSLAAGASGTITASVTGSVPAGLGAYYGSVNLTGSGVSMHIPYLFQVGNNLLASGSTFTGDVLPIFGTSFDGIAGTDNGPVAVQLMDASGLPVAGVPVTFRSSGGLTMKSVSGEPACSPASSTVLVTCNSDPYGIAYTDVVLGTTIAQETILAEAANIPSSEFEISVNIRQQPTISAGGVRDAAQAKTTVAPGSYVAISGAGLSDDTGSETTPALPLTLDGVTVSFDASGISVPGQLMYVSPTQVNVQVPWELQGLNGPVQMKVTLYEYEYGNLATATVADTAPSFFEIIPGTEVAAVIADTFDFITPYSPVARGTAVEIYANGLGPVNNQPASGNPAPSTKTASTKNAATVTIGGAPATVSYCGLVPGQPGLYEIDVAVPASISAGAQPVSLTIGGQTATSTIYVD